MWVIVNSNTLGDEEIVIHSVCKEPGSAKGSREVADQALPQVQLHCLKVKPVKPLALTDWPTPTPTCEEARKIVVQCAQSRRWPIMMLFQYLLDHGKVHDLHLTWQMM